MSTVEQRSERGYFEAALELEGDARESYLLEIGAREGSAVEQRIRNLLNAHELSGLDSASEFVSTLFGAGRRREQSLTGAATAEQPPLPVGTTNRHLDRGTLLAGRYRIVEFLGKGAMAEVYSAEDEILGGEVALKLLPAGAGGKRLALFLSEVRIARQVSHPHVCRVHDVDEDGGLRFMTMELIAGEDLDALLDRTGALPSPRAAEVGAQICDGLGAVHDKGILHRDLKPANVMIDDEGTVRLADFGVAGLAGDRSVGGTPAYMAPELWARGPATVQSELYALGLILYELFAGASAFSAGSISELRRRHLEELPVPLSVRCPGLPRGIAETIHRCLEKEPSARPLSAAAVAVALRGGAVPDGAGRAVRLRPWQPPALPAEPYPVLLPYRHRELFAGRDGEIDRLCAWLDLPRPIVGLSAPSGTGKSSLLAGGLYPALRGAGRPAVLERHPAEPGLAGRLAGGLLEATGGIALLDDDHTGFIALLDEAAKLAAGVPPVLIVDQLEDLFRPEARRARAVLGALLAATCQQRPGHDGGAPCRWLLAYREELSGPLDAWLRDVLADARDVGLSTRRSGADGLASLPRDLSTQDRFQAWPLVPLATPAGAAAEPLEEATAVFRRTIEAPLELTDGHGRPRYPWRFAGDGAERLARAFARARLAQPRAPLAPKLQVVLAYLLARASLARGSTEDGRQLVEVPDDVERLLDRALDDHLRRALETAFPAGRGAAQGRARALLALRELASATGARDAALPEAALEQAIGAEGRQVLETLSGPAIRLVVSAAGPEGRRWELAHDRLAEAVARLVEEEGRSGGLIIDSELLALRRRVGLQSALHASGDPGASRLPDRTFRRVATHADALLWDPPRRAWWAACRRRRRHALARRTTVAAAVALAALLAALLLRGVVAERAERAAVLEQLASGDPEGAASALVAGLAADGDFSHDDLRAALGTRAQPFDGFERGLGAFTEADRAARVLDMAELALPLVHEEGADGETVIVRLASLLWALDYGPLRLPALAERAQTVRDRALAPLWAARPPPGVDTAPWVDLPAGTFWMGARPGEGREGSENYADEFPRHQVTLSAFQMLAHEVTVADFRRFMPDHSAPDHSTPDDSTPDDATPDDATPDDSSARDGDLPVTRVTWYEATVYAAWLGGPGSRTRLPTEAEWEYAARLGCAHRWCTRGGDAAALSDIAWWIGNSADDEGEAGPHPIARLAPNQHGLYDLFGNVAEWQSDWYQLYPSGPRRDPVGPTLGEPAYRTLRGGSAFNPVEWVTPSGRATTHPSRRGASVGLRVVRPR